MKGKIKDKARLKKCLISALGFTAAMAVGSAESALVLRGNANQYIYNSETNLTHVRDWNLFKNLAATNANLVSDIAAVTPTIDGGTLLEPQDISNAYNANLGGRMTWFGAVAFINWMNNSNFGGRNDWQLPQVQPVDNVSLNIIPSFDGSTDNGYNNPSTASPLGHIYYAELNNIAAFDEFAVDNDPATVGALNAGDFNDLGDVTSWGSYWHQNDFLNTLGSAAFVFDTSSGNQASLFKANEAFTTPVIVGDVFAQVIPVPAAVWLLGSGIMGIFAVGGRRRVG